MPDKHLPIYQIQDFDGASGQGANFYFNHFQKHLQDHAFVQEPHKHNFYILLFITQGTGTHTIDFKTYEVLPGAAFFLSPGQVHAWELSPETTGFILFFDNAFYTQHQATKNIRRFPFFNSYLNPPYLHVVNEQFHFITDVLASIERELGNKLWERETLIRNYLDILLIHLTRLYHQHFPQLQPSGTYSVWQKLEDLMEDTYKQHQPITFYADQLHTSVKQLNDFCKNTTGKTISEIIQDRVILEAHRLLIHSSLTITQIAAELGYFDNSYFARFFKKQTGQTPEHFRSQVNS